MGWLCDSDLYTDGKDTEFLVKTEQREYPWEEHAHINSWYNQNVPPYS